MCCFLCGTELLNIIWSRFNFKEFMNSMIGVIIMLLSFNDRFIIFQQYRIPRESLLNRLSDVTVDGDYETTFTSPEQQLGKE